jgi:hypothetical protein
VLCAGSRYSSPSPSNEADVTEQEALTKWCPFARVGSERSGLGSINRDMHAGAAIEQALCIGSACMAFRSTPARRGRMSAIEEEIEMTAQSWCGLAGKP